MDKSIEEYKNFCKENGLKECCADNIIAFKKFKLFGKMEVNVILPMSIYDRIKAIEDYYMWADENDYNLECCATFIEYKKFLSSGGEK